MKRFVTRGGIMAGIAAVGVLFLTGCFGSGGSEPADTNEPPSGPTSVSGVDGTEALDGRIDDSSADSSSDGTTPSAGAPVDPPPVAASEEVRQLRELASRDPKVLAAALDYFESLDDDRELEIFLTHLEHEDDEVRRGAIYGVFTRFDPRNEQILAAIQTGLEDKDAIVRRLALKTMALDAFPREAFLDAVPRIAKHLDDQYEPDAATRAHVARMLRRYTTSCRPALPELIDAMKNDPDFNVRSASLTALYDIAQNADEALTTPTWLLENDPDPRLRRRAAIQLGKYKQAAAPAVDELISALADQGVPQRAPDDPLAGTDEPVCVAASESLARIGKPAVEPLLSAADSEDRAVRLLAIRTLGLIGPAAADAVQTLQSRTQSSDAGEATAAKAALLRITTP